MSAGRFDPETVGSVEHYLDPELYDHEYRRRRADVRFYCEVAREHGGPVLELACGTGRVLLALARNGHQVVGVDRSPAMLQRAAARVSRLGRAARQRVTLVRGDLRQFALRRRFPLIFCPFNSLQHLYSHGDVEQFLRRVAKHLAPDGRLVFDVLLPDLAWLTRDSQKHWARTRFKHPRTGRPVRYSTNHTYDPVSQIAYIRIFYEPLDRPPEERRTHVVRLAHRQFFPAELELLLGRQGFRILARYGGFRREPLDAQAESQVLVCGLPRREK